MLRSERLRAVLIWLGLIGCLVGIAVNRLWIFAPKTRLAESVIAIAIALVPALVLRWWKGWPVAIVLAVVVGAILIAMSGIAATAAVIVIALVGMAIGSLAVPQLGATEAVMALPVGLSIIGGAVGWLLPLPIHQRWVYLVIAVAICAWRARALRDALRALYRACESRITQAPALASIAIVGLGIASSGAWLPTMQADDLAYHLGLPTQLQVHGFYALDPTHQIWALAPWFGDVIQGIAQVIAGGEARGAVDALWMLSGAMTLACLTIVLGGGVRATWLVVVLFATQPLLAALLAGMQTELPATTMVAALALVVARGGRPSSYVAFATLAGGLCALKFGQMVAAIVLTVWAFARTRVHFNLKGCVSALIVFSCVAGSSYFYAWYISGNPMLPLFNDIFQSPVMAARQLDNPLYHAGFDGPLFWRITFDTSRYFEGEPGGFGFCLVALVGVWLVAVFDKNTRGITLAATAILVLPLVPLQYARYAFPGLMLLLPPIAVVGMQRIGSRGFAAFALAICTLDVVYQANASWSLGTVVRKRLLTHFADANYVLERFAPERVLIEKLRAIDAGNSVVLALDPRAPYVAELAGRGRTVAWYEPTLDAARQNADADVSGVRWKHLIDGTTAQWLLLRPAQLTTAQRAGLRLAGTELATIGDASLWSWDANAPQRTP